MAPLNDADQWRVLLVDDEEDIRDVMSLALADDGYAVHTAADGAAALNHFREQPTEIVITDIRMPGMNGIQVLKAVKKLAPATEVIVMTAFAEMRLAIEALQLDASDFITKPVDDAALQLALQRAKDRFQSRKQLRDYTAVLEKENARTLQELINAVWFQKNLIEHSMDGILACDRQGKVVVGNNSMARILGHRSQDALYRMTFDRFFAKDDEKRLRRDLAGEGHGGPYRLLFYEIEMVDTNGAPIPVQISASTLFRDNRETGWVCFVRDLRQMRKLEREMADQAKMLHQDKIMSLGRLAASVVHEINNPLSGILNYGRLMQRLLSKGPVGEDRRQKFTDHLSLIVQETDRCAQIVSSLLAFARKSTPAFSRLCVSDLLQRCIALSRHKLELQNITLITRIPSELPAIEGDFNQLQQCIINLVFNAIDAMPEGGTLKITVATRVDEGLDISITDSGIGIAPSDLPRIFEPFYTTKTEGHGVGLGLSTVYGIVERHKGSVAVDSIENRGTTFRIRLPLNASDERTA